MTANMRGGDFIEKGLLQLIEAGLIIFSESVLRDERESLINQDGTQASLRLTPDSLFALAPDTLVRGALGSGHFAVGCSNRCPLGQR